MQNDGHNWLLFGTWCLIYPLQWKFEAIRLRARGQKVCCARIEVEFFGTTQSCRIKGAQTFCGAAPGSDGETWPGMYMSFLRKRPPAIQMQGAICLQINISHLACCRRCLFKEEPIGGYRHTHHASVRCLFVVPLTLSMHIGYRHCPSSHEFLPSISSLLILWQNQTKHGAGIFRRRVRSFSFYTCMLPGY